MIGSAVKELTFAAFVNNLSAISFIILAITLLLLVLRKVSDLALFGGDLLNSYCKSYKV